MYMFLTQFKKKVGVASTKNQRITVRNTYPEIKEPFNQYNHELKNEFTKLFSKIPRNQ